MSLLHSVVLRLVFAFVLLYSSGAVAGTSSPLNVLFIAVDDLRPKIGCYGDEMAVTPHLDGLARRGVLFTRAYCQQAVCNPSRASVMTGRRPDTTRVWDLKTHFRKALPDVVTLPQYFKQHGYHTQCVGKIYHDPKWAQDAPSWSVAETYSVTENRTKYALDASRAPKGKKKGLATECAEVPDEAYIDGMVSDAACRMLREIPDKPFFLAVGFRRPHLPFSAPKKYWDLYDPKSLPMPSPTTAPVGIPKIALHNSAELRGYEDMPSTGPLSEAETRRLIHGYYASTSYMDAQLGKVFDELDRLDLTSNTVVVLWADHGYHLGELGLWNKHTNFELDTRVPLIIASPGQKLRGMETSALVELVDLYPTLVDLVGLPDAPGLEGVSLAGLLDNSTTSVKQTAFSQFPRPGNFKGLPPVMGCSVRTEKFRYTEWRNHKKNSVVARELYDHQVDPGELNNLADREDYREQQAHLVNLLDINFDW